jgi:hypothetical protein
MYQELMWTRRLRTALLIIGKVDTLQAIDSSKTDPHNEYGPYGVKHIFYGVTNMVS